MSFTLIIIILTVLVSISAFNNEDIVRKMILWPIRMNNNPSEYYRLLSAGLIHADWIHLFFNMYVLYIFGRHVENIFAALGQSYMYIIMYIMALAASSIPAMIKHKDNPYYQALGASGAVAAVMFSFAYFNPWLTISVWFIPAPTIVWATIYLVYSAYKSRRANDNIGHDAHFYGAIFGFLFTLAIDPTHGAIFFRQLLSPPFLN